jgi:hypothetical protein
MTDRLEDFRLFLFGQVNAFCVTAPFKIENIIFRPCMFIIADQNTIGIST